MIHLTPSQADAEFYRLVHDLLETRKAYTGSERRAEPRVAMWTKHRIAPLEGAGITAVSEFEEVICLDIHRGGFSFLREKPPTFRRLVAEFGTPSEPLYVVAEVVYFRPVLCWEGNLVEPPEIRPVQKLTPPSNESSEDTANQFSPPAPGEKMFHVGCKFLRRLSRAELQPRTQIQA